MHALSIYRRVLRSPRVERPRELGSRVRRHAREKPATGRSRPGKRTRMIGGRSRGNLPRPGRRPESSRQCLRAPQIPSLPGANCSSVATHRTSVLRHDQSKPLAEIRAELEKNGFFQKFPPAGTEVVSWYVMMGIGQVVTLCFPAERLRDVNLAVEQSAWGAFRTDFYPTYDYKPVAEAERKKK